MSEDRLQAEFFKEAWNSWPQTRRCLFSVPNGGSRNAREAMTLKATGLIAGAADMIFFWKGRAYGLELKTETGSRSDNQIKVHQAWHAQDIPVYLLRRKQDCLDLIQAIIEDRDLQPFERFLSVTNAVTV